MFARSRRSGAPLGIVSFDLDHFKQINDAYGHDTGDEVLAMVGELMTRSCRLGDVVARVGGEEFLALLPDTDARGALVFARKMGDLIGGMAVPGMREAVTASLGATVQRADDPNAGAMLQRVDAALYQAKHGGRNRAVSADDPRDTEPVTQRPATLAAA